MFAKETLNAAGIAQHTMDDEKLEKKSPVVFHPDGLDDQLLSQILILLILFLRSTHSGKRFSLCQICFFCVLLSKQNDSLHLHFSVFHFLNSFS